MTRKDRRPITPEGPRILFSREAAPLEAVNLMACFNADRQCFGPLEVQPFDGASIIVVRTGEPPMVFKCYEVEIKLEAKAQAKSGRATATAYVYARDYGNFKRFCEVVLKIDVVGRADENN